MNLPCRFCGSLESSAQYDDQSAQRWVEVAIHCHQCGARGPEVLMYNYSRPEEREALVRKHTAEAWELWNKPAPPT